MYVRPLMEANNEFIFNLGSTEAVSTLYRVQTKQNR